MSLAKDYFLLYHGINDIEQTTTYGTNENKDENSFFDIASLILSTNKKAYEKYSTLENFQKLVSQITNKEVKSIDDLYQLQFCLISAIKDDTKTSHIQAMHTSFEYLNKEKIIGNFEYNKLISLFDPNQLNLADEDSFNEFDDERNEEKKPFNEAKLELETTLNELEELFTTKDFIDELKEAKTYLNNQKFSIGITGVMNAGKSTMLNALMGQELLGSAVVPETANLTIVKHGKPSAKVFYWNKEEWNKIEKTAESIESIKEFVKETKKVFWK